MIANRSNVFAKRDCLYLLAIYSPRHLTVVGITEHLPFATKDKVAIIVQHKMHRFASPTCGYHIPVRTAYKLAFTKCAADSVKIIRTFSTKAIVLKIVDTIIHAEGSHRELSTREIHHTSGFCIRCPAAIHLPGGRCLVRADRASQGIRSAVIHISVLIVVAVVHTLLIRIQHGPVPVRIDVICSDNDFILIRRHIHIHTLEVERSDIEMEILVVHDGIRLAAGRTTNVVYGAALIDLPALHRLGTGIAVVVTGEVEVDTCRIAGCGEVFDVILTATGGIGVVGWDVRHDDFPLAIGFCCILHQPLRKLLQLVLFRGMVQHRDIHIASLHGVPWCRHAKHGLGRNGVVAVIIRLMVADHMENIRIVDTVHGEQPQCIIPLVVIADVVHSVAQLDTEVIRAVQLGSDTAHTFQSSFLLNIRQQEEIRLLRDSGNGKTVDIRPLGTVAHTEVVGLAVFQPGQRNGAHAIDLFAGGIGDQSGSPGHLLRAAHVGIDGKLHHSPIRAVRRMAHPRNGLAVLCLRQIKADIVGCARFIAHSVIAVQHNLEGAIALRVSRAQLHIALCSRQRRNVDLALIIGGPQQCIVGIYTDIRSDLTILDDSNDSGGLASYHGGIGLNAVYSLNGIGQ